MAPEPTMNDEVEVTDTPELDGETGASESAESGEPAAEETETEESVEESEVGMGTCEACDNTGLKDAHTICPVCNGTPGSQNKEA